MCLILWTLPNNNHPRIKFALASNRDECLDRPTSHASFWNLSRSTSGNIATEAASTVVQKGQQKQKHKQRTGILCGVDCKPPRANLRYDRDLPGTWVGVTTDGDLIALTDYLEKQSYYDSRPKPCIPKPSRGQLCGDFLVAMAEKHGSEKSCEEAEKWIRNHAKVWDTALEGLNLLVVQGAGDQQYVGANREGSELLILHKNETTGMTTSMTVKTASVTPTTTTTTSADTTTTTTTTNITTTTSASISTGNNPISSHSRNQTLWKHLAGNLSKLFRRSIHLTPKFPFSSDQNTCLQIPHGTVTGLSNSVFGRPWRRVEIGIEAIEAVLNTSLDHFGYGRKASQRRSYSTDRLVHRPQINDIDDDDSGVFTASKTSDTANIYHSISKTINKRHARSLNLVRNSLYMKDDGLIEMTWMVIEMLRQLRINTKPHPENLHSFELFTDGLQDRVFVPRADLEHLSLPHLKGEYGTRSSTVVLFGRNGQAVFVEKNWYAPRCPKTGNRPVFDVDSTDGIVWWQGQIGRPYQEWKQIQGRELEEIFACAHAIPKVC
ncbi:hypothetical protein BX616_005699 [Lobosporangium transversale]|uniref:NRDE protein-domain-containing protein n=1 Tax=Lobosporangium transversale TaxID=64571 RepID=A0A1Y2H0P6_9FUNG|nr:hypothetical protein BCR41DRAFT_344681 [Lobosporangium transversale]KAF9915636.1 hypothetical protein BX616_005699 [Lobosporangium transversale]ORZ28127.1 hypothetical protein BCR41DRAFT_344681 [Lobosporangium transversale]|eukprot:XP_021885812.1 hypothetical protein BCR41DRAFT_344681 [Lobosporangium transversale]